MGGGGPTDFYYYLSAILEIQYISTWLVQRGRGILQGCLSNNLIRSLQVKQTKKGFQLKFGADWSMGSRVMIGHPNPQTYFTTLYMD